MTTISRLHEKPDLDRHALAWYGQPVAFLAARAGLVLLRDPAAPPWSHELPGARTGHVVAVSSDMARRPQGAVVVGGPCMGDGTLGPTVEALLDTVQPLRLASHWACPCVMFVGDREEILGAGGEGKWLKTAERFVDWIERVAAAMDVATPVIVRTTSRAHEDALEIVGPLIREARDAELDAVFHLGSPSSVPPQGERDHEVTRRVVAAHLPDVAALHAGLLAAPHVVIAENSQQAGVATVARSLASRRGQQVSLVGHWPMPSLSASARMYRAKPWDKVPARDAAALARGEVAGAHPRTVAHVATWLDDDTLMRLAEASRAW